MSFGMTDTETRLKDISLINWVKLQIVTFNIGNAVVLLLAVGYVISARQNLDELTQQNRVATDNLSSFNDILKRSETLNTNVALATKLNTSLVELISNSTTSLNLLNGALSQSTSILNRVYNLEVSNDQIINKISSNPIYFLQRTLSTGDNMFTQITRIKNGRFLLNYYCSFNGVFTCGYSTSSICSGSSYVSSNIMSGTSASYSMQMIILDTFTPCCFAQSLSGSSTCFASVLEL